MKSCEIKGKGPMALAFFISLLPFVLHAVGFQQVLAQTASASLVEMSGMQFSYMNGGGFSLHSSAPMAFGQVLNHVRPIAQTGQLRLELNNRVEFSGTPVALAKYRDQDSLYQQGLNRHLTSAQIDLERQKTLTVHLGGIEAGYNEIAVFRQMSFSRAASGQSMSLFPSSSPSVFRVNGLR